MTLIAYNKQPIGLFVVNSLKTRVLT